MQVGIRLSCSRLHASAFVVLLLLGVLGQCCGASRPDGEGAARPSASGAALGLQKIRHSGEGRSHQECTKASFLAVISVLADSATPYYDCQRMQGIQGPAWAWGSGDIHMSTLGSCIASWSYSGWWWPGSLSTQSTLLSRSVPRPLGRRGMSQVRRMADHYSLKQCASQNTANRLPSSNILGQTHP